MPKKTNLIVIDGDVAYVHLTKGHVTAIDVADVELVRQHRWFASVRRRRDGSIGNAYAHTNLSVRGSKQRNNLQLHRLLTGDSQNTHVDHRDCDGLNNRRSNLRQCISAENLQNQRIRIDNTSGYKGVSRRKDTRLFRAVIAIGKKQLHLGYFKTSEEAATAYDVAAAKHYGEFARLNNVIPFPEPRAVA